MPKRYPFGFVTAFFAVTGGFGMVWHIYWLGALSLAAAVTCWIFLSWREDEETTLPAGEVAEAERLLRLLSVAQA
jgi:cytochrome o ubiquinol oxidase subunit 1